MSVKNARKKDIVDKLGKEINVLMKQYYKIYQAKIQ